jgi:hypothetical protein
MKRFFQTGFFLALKEAHNSHSEEWERMYDEFGDVIMENAVSMNREAYCHALNRILVELRFQKEKNAETGKKLLS